MRPGKKCPSRGTLSAKAAGKRVELKARVRFFAHLRDLFGAKEKEVEFEEGEKVASLLAHLCDTMERRQEIFEERNLKPSILVFKNGVAIYALKGLDTGLEDGDVINIFLFIGGG